MHKGGAAVIAQAAAAGIQAAEVEHIARASDQSDFEPVGVIGEVDIARHTAADRHLSGSGGVVGKIIRGRGQGRFQRVSARSGIPQFADLQKIGAAEGGGEGKAWVVTGAASY